MGRGRKRSLTDDELKRIIEMKEQYKVSYKSMSLMFGIPSETISRRVKQYKIENNLIQPTTE